MPGHRVPVRGPEAQGAQDQEVQGALQELEAEGLSHAIAPFSATPTRYWKWVPACRAPEEEPMVFGIAHLSPLLALLFGILILIFPRLLNYLVAIYLILSGLLGFGVLR
jgi:hypothetical protein